MLTKGFCIATGDFCASCIFLRIIYIFLHHNYVMAIVANADVRCSDVIFFMCGVGFFIVYRVGEYDHLLGLRLC